MKLRAQSISRGKVVALSAFGKDHDLAVVTFDDCESRVNLLSSSVMSELESVISELEIPGRYKGVIFRSGKSNCFIAGADIKEILKARSQPAEVAFSGCQDGKALLARISALPIKTVAAIHGRCLGGGAELAMACDERIASDSDSTVIGLPEVGLGVLPGWGGTVRASKMLGFTAALPLIMNPLKPWSARKAWRRGLVSEVVAEHELFQRAITIALGGKSHVCKKPPLQHFLRAIGDSRISRSVVSKVSGLAIKVMTRGKMPAPQAALAVMNAAFEMPEDKALELESRTFAELCHTPACGKCVQRFLDYQQAKKVKTA